MLCYACETAKIKNSSVVAHLTIERPFHFVVIGTVIGRFPLFDQRIESNLVYNQKEGYYRQNGQFPYLTPLSILFVLIEFLPLFCFLLFSSLEPHICSVRNT